MSHYFQKTAREKQNKKNAILSSLSTASRAMDLPQEHGGKIHLLITDVVMPEMNGRDLAGKLQSLYPGLKVLLMSGYTADVIAHRGILETGVHFMQRR